MKNGKYWIPPDGTYQRVICCVQKLEDKINAR